MDIPHPPSDFLSVERAISEIRAGRPVWVTKQEKGAFVLALEGLDEAAFTALEHHFEEPCSLFSSLLPSLITLKNKGVGGSIRVVLPAPRLQTLGISRADLGVLLPQAADIHQLKEMAFGLEGHLTLPLQDPTPLDRAALELIHLSLVLPVPLLLVPTKTEEIPALFPHILQVQTRDIWAYRAQKGTHVRLISRARVPLEGAPETEFIVFRGGEGLRDQVAVIIGHPDFSQPVPVRLHSACLTGDLFGSLKCDCGDQLRYTAKAMTETGGGIILYLDQEGRGNGLSSKIHAYHLQSQGHDTYKADAILGFDQDQRHFAFAADMLRQLGVKTVRLLTNNPKKIGALEASGLHVASHERIFGRKTNYNQDYLRSKRDQAGHFIHVDALSNYGQKQG